MSGGVLVAIVVALAVGGVCTMVAICLRGAAPRERPAILLALAVVVRAVRSGQTKRMRAGCDGKVASDGVVLGPNEGGR